MDNKHLNRFHNRAAHYSRYRPAYPVELPGLLEKRDVLLKGDRIADLGSGTGLSAAPFLANGYEVLAVEPNENMREEAMRQLGHFSGFKPVNGRAEDTGLEAASVDLVVAAQAFHWFNLAETKKECQRILKPSGRVLLMWNDRKTEADDFHKAFEDFLKYFGTDYSQINHKNRNNEMFDEFYGKNNYETDSLPNMQELSFEGLRGRVLSASYMPDESHADYEFMIYCLRKIFLRYQENGKIKLIYDTRWYHGTIK